jgi:hypothetical protein
VGGNVRGWRAVLAVATLILLGVRGLDLAMRTAPLPGPATRFFHYMDALERSGTTGVWERVLYSWILTTVHPSGLRPVS